MHIKDCFEILEIRMDTSPAEVKKAYRKLMAAYHPDKFQRDPKLRIIAEKKANEINRAKDELSAYLKDRKSNHSGNTIKLEEDEAYGKADEFFKEACVEHDKIWTPHLDLFMAYRSWCIKKEVKPISVEDLLVAVRALDVVSVQKGTDEIQDVYWPGIFVNILYMDHDDYWFDDDYETPSEDEPYIPEHMRDLDEWDDWAEIIF
jgi:curved DNA-binding protein CbpA